MVSCSCFACLMQCVLQSNRWHRQVSPILVTVWTHLKFFVPWIHCIVSSSHTRGHCEQRLSLKRQKHWWINLQAEICGIPSDFKGWHKPIHVKYVIWEGLWYLMLPHLLTNYLQDNYLLKEVIPMKKSLVLEYVQFSVRPNLTFGNTKLINDKSSRFCWSLLLFLHL